MTIEQAQQAVLHCLPSILLQRVTFSLLADYGYIKDFKIKGPFNAHFRVRVTESENPEDQPRVELCPLR